MEAKVCKCRLNQLIVLVNLHVSLIGQLSQFSYPSVQCTGLISWRENYVVEKGGKILQYKNISTEKKNRNYYKCTNRNCHFQACARNYQHRIRGAMVARLTPDQKVACSIHVGFNSCYPCNFFFHLFSVSFPSMTFKGQD